MRILVLSHNLIERGNYFRALQFARFLAARGHSVTFMPSSYRWYKPNTYVSEGITVKESPSCSFVIGRDDGWSPLGILYRLFTVLTHKYDMVYAFSHKPVDFIPAYFSRFARGSVYVTDWCDWWGKGGLFEMIKYYRDHNPHLSKIRKSILTAYDKVEAVFEEFVPKKADLVTVICHALYERARGLGIPKDKILRLVSGADTENINPMDKYKAREKLGIDSLLHPSLNAKEIVLLGYTANYHVDERFLLEAFSKVSRKMGNAVLLVVGPEFRIPEDQMRAWGLGVYDVSSKEPMKPGDRILHFGRRPFQEIKTFLAASDILLLPMTDILYNKGRWPHKIGDYLASGRPVVVSDVGDIPLLLKGKEAGIIAPADSEAFAESIIALCARKDLWDLYGSNARRIAETELSWENICSEFYEKFREKFHLE